MGASTIYGLVLWCFALMTRTHDICEGNVITRSEIEIDNIRSLRFWDIRKGVTLRRFHITEFKVYLYHTSRTNQWAALLNPSNTIFTIHFETSRCHILGPNIWNGRFYHVCFSLMIYFDDQKTQHILEGNVITRSKILIENIHCLGFWDIQKTSDIHEIDVTEFRVYLHHMSFKHQWAAFSNPSNTIFTIHFEQVAASTLWSGRTGS